MNVDPGSSRGEAKCTGVRRLVKPITNNARGVYLGWVLIDEEGGRDKMGRDKMEGKGGD